MPLKTTKQQQPPVDMSAKVGGRIFQPALPVVDGDAPTAAELAFNKSLVAWTHDHIPLETVAGIQTRERVLDRMGVLCREWIQSVCAQKGLSQQVAETAGGSLFTSGSYRLGIHEPSADIDCILVAPHMCRRNDFFGTSTITESNPNRDPNSLAERIRRQPDVTNLVPIEGAAVPILTFDWEGINIDLLFARINSNSVGPDFDIDNDTVLDGADSATEKSLNGPRVTNLIAALVSGTPQRYQTFLSVVRCVRAWAKARGLYSNKMGYWGGVNINMGVALVVQLYPNACAASLLRKFFLVFKTWRWPQPVLLTKPHDASYGLPVWSPQSSARQVAPMITPAYPAMNSTLSISRQTLQIMQGEFERGHKIVDQLWKEYNSNSSNSNLKWDLLFEKSDFFVTYPLYLSLCIVGPSQAETQAWAGFVESRLRKLVSDLLARSLPLKKIQLWPKKIECCIADKGAILALAQRQNSMTYFIGFQVDKLRMRGNELNIELPLSNFREWELGRFQPLIPGMDILAKVFKVKDLPKICFQDMYEGGKDEAMQRRRKILDADPVRQEKKRLAKYNELKAKMAEIQMKKEEKTKKRNRAEVETDDQVSMLVKEEIEGAADAETSGETPVETEETDLLQSALDTIQETGEAKTREEAEADRQKLLSGELMEEGDDKQNVSDDDEYGYTMDRGRHSLMVTQLHKDKRSLPLSEGSAEILKKLGYAAVSDDEAKVLGANMIPPWRDSNAPPERVPSRVKFNFLEKVHMMELDAMGYVIDTGDDDFTPSKTWTGRRAGFEFKLHDRGLGYYRTGKKVVVPSNTAY